MEVEMRIGVTIGAEVDLGASPQLFDSAGSGSQICSKIGPLLVCALAELFFVSFQSQRAASLMGLIFEKIKDSRLHFADFEHDSFAAFMVFIAIKASHLNYLL